MKNFRIYYRTAGIITKKTPMANIIAKDSEEAVAKFRSQYGNYRTIVAIFA